MRVLHYVVLLLSAAMAVAAGKRMLDAPPIWGDEPLEWAKIAGAAAVLMAAVVLRWPRHAAAAATLSCVGVAAAISPAAVVTLALLLGFAALVGGCALRLASSAVRAPAIVATLVGVSMTIGVMAVTSRWRIHYGPVYAGIAIIAFIVCRHRVAGFAAQIRAWVIEPQPRSGTEIAWIAIAGVIALVRIVLWAKPEVGYDASAVHLQYAELLAADHAFRYGIDRYIWALMPLGADHAFAAAYLVGGQPSARAVNLAFAAFSAALVYRLGLHVASREAALACATLFASMPLSALVTGSLFSEALWVALLLATLLVVIEGFERRTPFLGAFAILAGGAMATKVMSVFWIIFLVPVAVWVAYRDRAITRLRLRDAAQVGIGVAIGAWTYVAAWVTTGNPVFPFMNAVFRSPFYSTSASFDNPLFNSPLHALTPWELVFRSASFIEGRDGALGFALLLALPIVLLQAVRRPPLAFRLMAVLAVFFFVAIYLNQSYLRYLLPAFALTAVLASCAVADLVRTRTARVALLVVGIALVAFDVRAIANAHHAHTKPCLRCIYDTRAREQYVELFAPLRAVSARLNQQYPDARVGFMVLNEEAPAGYVGMSRSANWHDDAFFRGIARATTREAVLAIAREHKLTHIVYRATPDPAFPAISAFASHYATPLWRVGDYVVALLQPASGG